MGVRIVIVGGGPAGACAGIVAARAGVEVILLESQPFPRERPGETLHPGVQPLLRKLGVFEQVEAAGFLRHPGVWVQRQGRKTFEAYGQDERGKWLGYQALRSSFDKILLEEARQLGVCVRQPEKARELVQEAGRVRGVLTTLGMIDSDHVLDATGSQRWVARRLGLRAKRHSEPLLAQYGYASGACSACDEAPVFDWYERNRWVWTARIGENLYHWTRILKREDRFQHDWRPDEFRDLSSTGPARAADVTWTSVDECAGPGFFLLGDAAAVLDPSSAHGVLRAIMSGMMAGHLIAQAGRKAAAEKEIALHYREWMGNWIAHDMKRLSQFQP
jgi:flavin-dependent dehydrogenase